MGKRFICVILLFLLSSLIFAQTTIASEAVKTASTIPWVNLVTIVVAVIVLLYLMRRFGIKNFLGIRMDIEDSDSLRSLNKKNDEADRNLQGRMRNYVDEMGEWIEAEMEEIIKKLNCIKNEYTELAITALASSLRFPFYNTISSNHFTTVLKKENIEAYKDRISFQLCNRYHRIEKRSGGLIPHHDLCKEFLDSLLSDYIETVKSEVVITCKEKLRNNELHLKTVKSAKNIEIIESNIKKNEGYIKELER